jgi:hypothetical protein
MKKKYYKLPKTISILGRLYTISYNPDLTGAYGQCDKVRGEIQINPVACGSKELILKTTWHEIGHAWCWESGMSNFLSSQAEEMVVESFANLNYSLHGGSFRSVKK